MQQRGGFHPNMPNRAAELNRSEFHIQKIPSSIFHSIAATLTVEDGYRDINGELCRQDTCSQFTCAILTVCSTILKYSATSNTGNVDSTEITKLPETLTNSHYLDSQARSVAMESQHISAASKQ
jgi:hypothetical protein